MKDHEISQFVNKLTALMHKTPDAQKRAVLSRELTGVLRRPPTLITNESKTMATRSNIIAKTETGYAGIYVHSDGYLDHVGKTLLAHYSDPRKVAELIALGNLSTLGAEIGEKHDWDWRREFWGRREDYCDDPRYKMCMAYGRDREEEYEKEHEAQTLQEVKEYFSDCCGEYCYVFDGESWTFNGVDLRQAIETEDSENTEPK